MYGFEFPGVDPLASMECRGARTAHIVQTPTQSNDGRGHFWTSIVMVLGNLYFFLALGEIIFDLLIDH